MRSNLLKGVVLGAVTSTLVLAAASAFAGTGVGGIFNLGKTNAVSATSTLGGTTAGQQLKVTNASASASGVGVYGQSKSTVGAGVQGVNNGGGPAVQANVIGNTVAPLRVNSTHVVPKLNANMVGGYQLVSNHMKLSVGTTSANLLTLPGIGAIEVSCVSGPQSYFALVDNAGPLDVSLDEGSTQTIYIGTSGFTTGPSGILGLSTLDISDNTKATGPVSTVRFWQFPGLPDSSHCFYQASATVQP